jgi:predicted DCC family thiol-disulfide oxidoreductase YuxK
VRDDLFMRPAVIYDGECDFCISCVNWLKRRLEIEALANQEINPEEFGVSKSQCEKSVVVIDEQTYFGAGAVAFLLNRSGYKFLSNLIILSGPVGRFGYSYVAAHRNGMLVKLLHLIIKKTT